jgi:hypothetical protein
MYADLVGSEDPLDLLASTPLRIAELVRNWDAKTWERTYAPGKWTAAQLVLHLAQDEIGWGNRVRLALSVPDYVVQPYDGDRWVDLETPADPQEALDAYLGLRRLDVVLFRRLSAEQRARPVPHPEAGPLSIEWIIRTLAGHDLHHLRHLETIAGS